MACEDSNFVGTYDIIGLPQGVQTTIPISYKTGDPLAVVDLSTYTAKLQVRKTFNSQVLLELSTSDSSITVSATSPNITLIFTSAKTENMTTYDNMIYDLEIYSSSGVPTRILQGEFSISRQVTQ